MSHPTTKLRDTGWEFPEDLPQGWHKILATELNKDYFQKLIEFLKSEQQACEQVFPANKNILKALQLLDFDSVRVVILGQDPYHGAGQALGLSFAVPNSLKPKPPSLVNIFKEIASDLNVKIDPTQSELTQWVKQGVLLLNTVLTVRAGQAFSHRGKGWEIFTDRIISELGARKDPLVFILWGAAAQKKKILIRNQAHCILESVHPSPLSSHRGFFGSKPFSKSNAWLETSGLQAIDWAETS